MLHLPGAAGETGRWCALGGLERPRDPTSAGEQRRPSPSLRHGGFLLFNFPLRYLLTIGLVPVFSLRWSLPPALGCIPKQPDSGKTRARRAGGRYRPHTVHGLGLDQKDLGPPRAAPGSGSSPPRATAARPRGRATDGAARPSSLGDNTPSTPDPPRARGTQRGVAATRGKARSGGRRRGVPRAAAGARVPGARPRARLGLGASRPDRAKAPRGPAAAPRVPSRAEGTVRARRPGRTGAEDEGGGGGARAPPQALDPPSAGKIVKFDRLLSAPPGPWADPGGADPRASLNHPIGGARHKVSRWAGRAEHGGAHAAAAGGSGGGSNAPHTERRGPRRGEREDAPHSPRPSPARNGRARRTGQGPATADEGTPAAAPRGEGPLQHPPTHTPGRPRWRRAGGAGRRRAPAGAGARRAGPEPDPPHTHQPPAEAARGRKGHSGRPGPDPRPGTRAGARGGGAHGIGREERPLVGTRHHRRAGGGRHGWEATTGLRSTSAPGRGTGSAGRRGEAARQRLGDKGLGRQKPEQPRGKRTAGRREGAQEPLKRRLPRPEVSHRGTRGPTAQGLQHKGGPMAPEDNDPAHGRPWPPRGARDPGHPGTVTTDPQQDTLPRARRHPSVPRSTGPARPLLLTGGRGSFAQGRPPPQEPLEAGEGTTPNSGEAVFGPEGVDRGHSAPSAVQASQGQSGGGGEVGGDGEGRVPSGRRPTSACRAVRGGGEGRTNEGASRAASPSRNHDPGGSAPRRERPDPWPHVTAGGHSARERAADTAARTATGQETHGRGGVATHARTHSLARTREPHVPDVGQARRDPPPTRRGEAQAAAPSRIAREGFLTEGTSPPPIRPPDRAPRDGVPQASKGLGAGVGLRRNLVPPPWPREERRRARLAGQNSGSPRLAKRTVTHTPHQTHHRQRQPEGVAGNGKRRHRSASGT
ncbi:collagen alpha-1(I) chain-like [Mustela lutreola]|uniref:collagen alpha-1(I) chain-like n=1 Tax=Mustela lutreola TaxID=9666 RepID=UPI00279734EB|nr:collagen alpha-1(I) chain-like [Mustela lutreola]